MALVPDRKQEYAVEMAHRALYLANESHIDQEIVQILQSKCADVQIVTALAQATALIESPSLAQDHGSYKSLIVADVSAGGIVLAEYIDNLFSRLGPLDEISPRPIMVLVDAEGNVTAARKALRLGVDGYILGSDSAETKSALLDSLMNSSPRRPLPEPSHSSSNGYSATLATDGPHTLTGSSFSQEMMSPSRLSQIESAIMSCLSSHSGNPLSARSIVNEVMGRDMDEDKAASLIRPHISRLRSKVEPTPQMPQRLLTVRGKGYMFII